MEQAIEIIPQERTREKKCDFVALYKSKACNISMTCEAVDIGRTTFYRWCEEDPAFGKAIKEIEASVVDWVENVLLRNISDGKEKSLIFYLLNRRPNMWKDKSGQITVSQTNVNINKLDPSQIDDKELDSVVRNIVANR